MPIPVSESPEDLAMRFTEESREDHVGRQVWIATFPAIEIHETPALVYQLREAPVPGTLATMRIQPLSVAQVDPRPLAELTPSEQEALGQIRQRNARRLRRESLEEAGVTIGDDPAALLDRIADGEGLPGASALGGAARDAGREMGRLLGLLPDARGTRFTPEAEERAEALLLSHLDDVQRWTYDELGKRHFDVLAASGVWYTISHQRSVNVETDHGRRYCLGLPDAPIADQLLVQKIMLETDEEGFLEQAREWPWDGPRVTGDGDAADALRRAGMNPPVDTGRLRSALDEGVRQLAAAVEARTRLRWTWGAPAPVARGDAAVRVVCA